MSGEELAVLVRKEHEEKTEQKEEKKILRYISGKKTCIKIDAFAAWLKNITPLLSEGLSFEEKSSFCDALRYLSAQIKMAENKLSESDEKEGENDPASAKPK